ncbi:MAG: exonuclease SbcCD subunit D [Prevotella sp.]|nr:exonuclease SbcCD subunit D [Prevotella sp.]MBR6192254.1 exonuclease SbcCD subunit D [Prevotella sp.]
MKILHTADLHLGQIIYQNYDRSDEHAHFFSQLEEWCRNEQPDALLVSGDVFDIQQPSAAVRKTFTDYFVRLHSLCPAMHIVITAGNHDSASRIQADSAVWQLANTHLVGIPPAANAVNGIDGWQRQYIIRLDSGFIVALPYMTGGRREVIQSILDKVAADNIDGLPVVMMAHQAVTGLDITGHDFDLGHLRTLDAGDMGDGFDYLALGHIHKPQTIGRQEDAMIETAMYPAPVIRYSGSALHVSCDENYPHTVSMVSIDRHGGEVNVRQLRIDELRHFYTLPTDGSSFSSADEALDTLSQFICQGGRGYLRFRFKHSADLPSNFNQMVYDILELTHDEWRYNPKVIWTGAPDSAQHEEEEQVFEVAELQQMTDPMTFIERTSDQYPGLDLDDVRQAFEEVRAEMLLLSEDASAKKRNNNPEIP